MALSFPAAARRGDVEYVLGFEDGWEGKRGAAYAFIDDEFVDEARERASRFGLWFSIPVEGNEPI
jgi:hypothetical protein